MKGGLGGFSDRGREGSRAGAETPMVASDLAVFEELVAVADAALDGATGSRGRAGFALRRCHLV